MQQQIAWAEQLLEDNSTAKSDNKIFNFAEIAARGRHRFDLRLDVGPLWQRRQDRLQAAMHAAPWLPVVHEILGEDVVSIISVVYSMPGADAQVWPSPSSCTLRLWQLAGTAPRHIQMHGNSKL